MMAFLRKCSFLDARYRDVCKITEEEKEEIVKELKQVCIHTHDNNTSASSTPKSTGAGTVMYVCTLAQQEGNIYEYE